MSLLDPDHWKQENTSPGMENEFFTYCGKNLHCCMGKMKPQNPE